MGHLCRIDRPPFRFASTSTPVKDLDKCDDDSLMTAESSMVEMKDNGWDKGNLFVTEKAVQGPTIDSIRQRISLPIEKIVAMKVSDNSDRDTIHETINHLSSLQDHMKAK